MAQSTSSPAGKTSAFGTRTKLMAATLSLLIAATLGMWFLQSSGSSSAQDAGIDNRVWYTSDDGKTFFADLPNDYKSVQRDGKQAYRCYVFTCEGESSRFVGYLERYAPDSEKKLRSLLAPNAKPDPTALQLIMLNGVQLKKPGGAWIKSDDNAAMALLDPSCPTNPRKKAVQIVPTAADK